MKKALLIFLIIIISTSCCNSPDRLIRNEYGLKGNVKQITQYAFLKNDSLTHDLDNDTISIKKTFFNKDSKIERISYHYNFNNQSESYDFEYNENNVLIQEIVNSFDVKYYYKYKDSLIISRITKSNIKAISINHKTDYEYSSKKLIKKAILSQVHLDSGTKDIIRNTIETYIYNSNGYEKKAIVTYLDSLNKSEKYIYKRDCEGLLLSTKSYKSDKLISELTNKYSFDEIGNWIEMKVFDKDTLRKIFTREILYN